MTERIEARKINHINLLTFAAQIVSREEHYLSGWKERNGKTKRSPVREKTSGRKAKTYAELIALIRNKGFIVDDEEAARDLLRRTNYSGLTAYFQPFRRPDGSYAPNVNFRRVGRICEFDGKISAVLFECVGEIERYLRAQFAYFSGHEHGAFGYLEESTFSKKHRQERFIGQVDECVKKNAKILAARFHDEEEDGKFPIWVMIEFFTMGMLSYFYRDLKRNDRKILAKRMYGTIPERLISWLQCLVKLRNRCAHYSRLYDWSFAALPDLPPKITFIPEYRLFTQIMVLKLLYPDPEKWKMDTLAKIETLIAEYGGGYFSGVYRLSGGLERNIAECRKRVKREKYR